MTNRLHGAFIYARFSTEHQNSIEEQVDACSRYCLTHGLTVLGTYADRAVSGTKLSRQDFDRMMEDLRRGLADTIIIYDQSRLMRDIEGWFTLRRDLEILGVRIISATQAYVGGDIRSSNTFLMESVQATFDQMHVLITREKVVEKLHYMARSGLHTGGVPALGYKTTTTADGKKRLVIAPDEAATVCRIFREYDEGKTYKQIIDGLNADGILTKRGRSFGSNSLHDLLHNPLYVGTVVYGSRAYRADGSRNTHSPEGSNVVTREDPALAIIDRDQFQRVQIRMSKNRQQQGGRPATARDYPLKGRVFCGECGSAVTAAASKIKGRTYFYYRCTRKDRTHDCTGKPIRCDELEQLVVESVRAMIGNPDIREAALEVLRAEAEAIGQTGIERYNRLSDELKAVKAKISRLIAAIEDGNYTASISERLKELDTQRQTLELRIAELHRAADVARLPQERLSALFEQMCTLAQTDTAAVLSIVSRVEIYNDYIKIYTVFDPDPKKQSTEKPDKEFVLTPGISSGVPIVFITPVGLALQVQRRRK